MKKVILCADDYGQNSAVSQAIIELLTRGRISATSCLVNMRSLKGSAMQLIEFRDKADIGLHFNLTEGEPLSTAMRRAHGFLPLGKLLFRAMSGWLDRRAIVAEVHAQLDAFEAMFGMQPGHIDGHQHVHHFPVVRDALLEVYDLRLRDSGCWVRQVSVEVGSPAFIKKAVLNISGAVRFRERLARHAIPHNHYFSGIYPFSRADRYAQYFRTFLAGLREGGLILCHPGLPGASGETPLGEVRAHEFRYLASEDFLADCATAGFVPARFAGTASAVPLTG